MHSLVLMKLLLSKPLANSMVPKTDRTFLSIILLERPWSPSLLTSLPFWNSHLPWRCEPNLIWTSSHLSKSSVLLDAHLNLPNLAWLAFVLFCFRDTSLSGVLFMLCHRWPDLRHLYDVYICCDVSDSPYPQSRYPKPAHLSSVLPIDPHPSTATSNSSSFPEGVTTLIA